MNYKILRTYQAIGSQWYAVVYFPDLAQQNEILMADKKEDLTKKAEAMYASRTAPQYQNIEKVQNTQTKIIVDGKIIYSGAMADTVDISTDLKKQFTISAKAVGK